MTNVSVCHFSGFCGVFGILKCIYCDFFFILGKDSLLLQFCILLLKKSLKESFKKVWYKPHQTCMAPSGRRRVDVKVGCVWGGRCLLEPDV